MDGDGEMPDSQRLKAEEDRRKGSASFPFFLRLSSGYSCSICSSTTLRTPHARTHSHTPRVLKQTYSYTQIEDRILREVTGVGSVGGGHVAIPLWLHAERGITCEIYLWDYAVLRDLDRCRGIETTPGCSRNWRADRPS